MKIDPQLKWKLLFVLFWMVVPFVLVGLVIAFRALIALIGMNLAFLIAISLIMGVASAIMVFTGELD